MGILGLLSDRNMRSAFWATMTRPRGGSSTADFVYSAGPRRGGRYEGRYPAATLGTRRKSILRGQIKGCDSHVYFDNDQKTAAPMGPSLTD
jgi:uncharacterized protein YecE (DUF72 family)